MKRETDPAISNVNKSGGHYVLLSETLWTQTVTHGLIHEYFLKNVLKQVEHRIMVMRVWEG